MNNIGVREMAKEIGASASTINRLERGVGEPDCKLTIKLIEWLFKK